MIENCLICGADLTIVQPIYRKNICLKCEKGETYGTQHRDPVAELEAFVLSNVPIKVESFKTSSGTVNNICVVLTFGHLEASKDTRTYAPTLSAAILAALDSANKERG